MQTNKIDFKLVVLLFLIVIVACMAFYFLEIRSNNSTKSSDNPVQEYQNTREFTDGLGNPDKSQQFDLSDFDEGVAQIYIFYRDINADKKMDKITRIRHENGTAHYKYEYKIELNQDDKYINITPDDFTTTEGADCSLRKFQFIFTPNFKIIEISRPWVDTWTTPTNAHEIIYLLHDTRLQKSKPTSRGVVCDVKTLF